MADIASAFAEAAAALGHDVVPSQFGLPTDDGAVHLVIAPHEFFRLRSEKPAALRAALACSVLVTTEQPGTPWFEFTVDLARGARAVWDINRVATDALASRGVNATYVRLGATPGMDATRSVGGKDIDVVFLGALDRRRGEVLASMAPTLDAVRAELRLFPPDQPVVAGSAGLYFGNDKYALLARSRVLVNVHRASHDSTRPYFEWARMVEAMANDCVVVTEPSAGYQPLAAGTHFVEATVDTMAHVVPALLADHQHRAAVAQAARAAVMGEVSLRHTLGAAILSLDSHTAVRRRVPTRAFGEKPRAQPRPVFQPHLDLQRRAKRLVRQHDDLLRELAGVQSRLRGRDADAMDVECSPAWEDPTLAPAEVSVVVSLYNYESHIGAALDSVLQSRDVRFEVVVIDDASTDNGLQVCLEHLRAHPLVPWLVASKVCNAGLSQARNTGFSLARAEAVMVLDADNLLHPHGLSKLLRVLGTRPDAAGAYGILDDFGDTTGLRSAFDWDVRRLCRANYIDAQALLRRSVWDELGGYRDNDDVVYGWEDWDLWLRIAAAGTSMAFCPEIIGSYRTQASSMVSLSNIAADDMRTAMRARHPGLPWPSGT